MKNYFKNKKILMMGLGILGRGINIAKFLAEQGAILTITDLKTKQQLAPSIAKLNPSTSLGAGNIKYVLGEHRLSDFKNKDMVIKAAGVPLGSPYLKEAKKNKIPVEMDASLFAKTAEGVILVGITGTRGKSTVTHLLYEILHLAMRKPGIKVFIGGNVKGLATLPLLKKVRVGDIVVMELDSWQLQGFGDAKISPHIAIFTTFLRDHMNYYNDDMEKYFSDKANIYRFQNKNDLLIMRPDVAKIIKKKDGRKIKSKTIIVGKKSVPQNWKVKLLGKNNLENIALAITVAEKLGVDKNIIKKAVENFGGLSGRLEFVKEINGVKYYNDTTATTPDGVINALESLGAHKGKIILIGGGADKKLAYDKYAKIVKKYVKVLILFKGAASDKILSEISDFSKICSDITSMKDAIKLAQSFAKKGDIILLSPGAASFGVFKNEFDRGEQFCKFVKKFGK